MTEMPFPLSPEHAEKLRLYHALLVKWQKAINLVSPATLPDAAHRHFLDSAQLVSHLSPEARTLVDLGSGAGFPGLVLAILRPDLEVHLVESDQKKCAFLEAVSREIGAGVHVHPARIEALAGTFPVDVLTARALAPLSGLLDYAAPWFSQNIQMTGLFLKGGEAPEEIARAEERWILDLEVFPSQTNPQGRILKIRNLRLR